MSKKTFTFIIIIVLAAIAGAYYWFFVRNTSPQINILPGTNQGSGTFNPFDRSGGSGQTGNGQTTGGTKNASTSPVAAQAPAIPVLRHLSLTPVGGMTASTTGSTTIVRWIDRGAGHIFQAYSDNLAITELSNTTVPRVFETYWSGDATNFILRSLGQTNDDITNFFAVLFPISNFSASTTAASSASNTPYELRGSPVPSNTLSLAVSPKGNSLFALEKDTSSGNGGGGIGYTTQFNGTKKTKIVSTPLTQVNIEWPEANTVAMTTKSSAFAIGDLFFINVKTGSMTPILTSIRGLETLTSKDAKNVLFNNTINGGIKTSVYNVGGSATQNMLFNTMPAEKCVWSSIQKSVLYCAVPFQIPDADYPDAWYQGKVSFADSIWEVNTATGETHLISDLTKATGTSIDATNLVLDPHENYLYFINKSDLTLWSLELNG